MQANVMSRIQSYDLSEQSRDVFKLLFRQAALILAPHVLSSPFMWAMDNHAMYHIT